MLVAAGVARGSDDMKMMKDVIGDPRTKTYADSGLSTRMAEVLPARKVPKNSAKMHGGSLQMNFRSGASPGTGNTVRF